jgi:pimeloyl-ACP methyl ester carboxylesterase
LSIVVAMTGGVAVVNYYYGYYTTWGQMWADFHGGTGNLGVITPATSATALGSGRLGWADLTGKLSGYDRRGLVYLPPQYSQAKYARIRFPVVELFHGTPGTSPLSWDNRLATRSRTASTGPPSTTRPTSPTTCAPTYARYRVSHDPFEWGLAGYSSGGYRAANLALRHPGSFGAAAVINGYFRAADGPAGAALNNSPALEAAAVPRGAAHPEQQPAARLLGRRRHQR